MSSDDKRSKLTPQALAGKKTGAHQVPKLKPVEDRKLLRAIIDAVSEYDLASSPEWDQLDQLSTHTEFESIDANPDGIFEGPDNSFEAVGDVYVTLNYGDRRDSTAVSDAFPVQVAGTFDRQTGKVVVESVTIDTSSFYN